ncbi:MAG: HAD-IIIA family hydrolase [Bacteroidia bacterium]|nr:HAD-IIIA family hydrolase [Bacteroidia bacterium]
MIKQVVILAGGKGTRLFERLGNLPKPLIDVCGKPLLERQILLVKHYGFERVLILINYRAEDIVDFCQSKNNWELDIRCFNDGEPCGTAGAVLQCYDELDDEFLLMYGDTMLDVDLHRFYKYHSEDIGVAATLFLHPNDHPHDSDLVVIDEDGYITDFYPYPRTSSRFYPNLVNAALYYIRKAALEPWRNYTGGSIDFGKQLFPAMIEKGFQLRGYNSPEYIKDCGTPARIDKVCNDFESGRIARSVLSHLQKAVFLDRDGTINREVDQLNLVDQFELLPGVEQAIKLLNRSEYRVCVVTNQPVIARGECSRENLNQIHNKLETLLGQEGAFIDRIYYCPHHPDKGFSGEIKELKIDCDCRKPKSGMINKAIFDLNIDINQSWMIGDTTADIMLAYSTGLKSILVETGLAGLDEKYLVTPDFIVPDLLSGVSFILNIYPRLIKSIKPISKKIMRGEIVFIGGQARSGKSSFASALRHILEEHHLRCHILSTDSWLLNETERGDNILARHNIAKLQDVIQSLYNPALRPTHLVVPGYRKTRRENLPNARIIKLNAEDIIIVEGVVALELARITQGKHKFFIEIEEYERKKRMLREYINRGFNLEAANAVYLERLREEVPWIEENGIGALKISIPVSKYNIN